MSVFSTLREQFIFLKGARLAMLSTFFRRLRERVRVRVSIARPARGLGVRQFTLSRFRSLRMRTGYSRDRRLARHRTWIHRALTSANQPAHRDPNPPETPGRTLISSRMATPYTDPNPGPNPHKVAHVAARLRALFGEHKRVRVRVRVRVRALFGEHRRVRYVGGG